MPYRQQGYQTKRQVYGYLYSLLAYLNDYLPAFTEVVLVGHCCGAFLCYKLATIVTSLKVVGIISLAGIIDIERAIVMKVDDPSVEDFFCDDIRNERVTKKFEFTQLWFQDKG